MFFPPDASNPSSDLFSWLNTSATSSLQAIGFVLFLASLIVAAVRCKGSEISTSRAFVVAFLIGLVREAVAGAHTVLGFFEIGITTDHALLFTTIADQTLLVAYLVILAIASVIFWGYRSSVSLWTGGIATVGAVASLWLGEISALHSSHAIMGYLHLVLATAAFGLAVLGWLSDSTGSRVLSIAWGAVLFHQTMLAANEFWIAGMWVIGPDWLEAGFLMHIPGILLALNRRDQQLLHDFAGSARDQVSVVATALLNLLEVVDVELKAHQERHAELSRRIAERLGLKPQVQEDVYWATLLHDIGKLTLEKTIFVAPRRLTPEEWMLVRSHPENGARILQDTPGLYEVARIVRFHHERWAGGGYPDGIEGERIPVGARIVALVDAFDAMIGPRTYRRQRSVYDAVTEIQANAGTQFDPMVVEAFVEELRFLPAGGGLRK